MPVTVCLLDAPAFHSETVTISSNGAKLRVGAYGQRLTRGDTVNIALRGSRAMRAGKVVWLDHRSESCGVELYEANNFWGVYFPPVGRNLAD